MPEEPDKDSQIAALELANGKLIAENATLRIENASHKETVHILQEKIKELL